MKTISVRIFAGICLAAVVLTSARQASGRGADWPSQSLAETHDLSFLSVSATYEEAQRSMESSRDTTHLLKTRHVIGRLSVELLGFLTVTGGAGTTWIDPEHEDEAAEDRTENGFLLMQGARIRLWSHRIEEPSFLASRISFDTGVSYWDHESTYLDTEIEWEEIRGSFALNAEVLAETWGNESSPCPYSIVFTLGAVYSEIDLKSELPPFAAVPLGSKTEFSEENQWGALVGATLFVARNVSVSLEGCNYENPTYSFGAALHF